MLNIGGTIGDPFYRYKMPRVTTVVQKKSGGTTVVNNTPLICASLKREPAHIARYLNKTLSRPVSVKADCWTMHGKVETAIIQEAINNYVRKFVLCSICGNPETMQEGQSLHCNSCGADTKL